MANEVTAALAALTLQGERLAQGLRAMTETQAMHGEMLRQLLEAAAEPTAPEERLGELLARMVTVLGEQTTQLNGLRASLERLPGVVAEAVGQGVREALRDV